MAANHDERFMRVALGEAKKALGRTSPNPAVGAVLVVGDQIVARGHHRGAGQPHAEVECLTAWGKPVPPDATLFVTLEPCFTMGRTGPCTDAIIQAGIKKVVIGTIDLNPRHRGRAIDLLSQARIQVRSGVLADECASLNEHFNKWIVTGQPFVIAKCGMSLDGRLTRRPGEACWLTSAAARRDAHDLRAQIDAILIGAETLRRDNPRLTVRGVAGARQPLRVVLTRSGKLPRDAHLFRDRFRGRTLVYEKMSLRTVLMDLGAREVTSVLIEGGGEILGQALDDRLIDKIQIYVAPLFTGGPAIAFGGKGTEDTAAAARLERISFAKIGQHIRIAGYPQYADERPRVAAKSR
jgi:diaminohydroxyphosphoribosylaminopyrimidine deaminase/5-amino-6-(5-phosphoribosylamino)uracil reductase